ncbi:TIR-like protein FxsC [Plantactinospora sp. WMMB782]|uniref:TIR-like protein FxsC n=1 Tax=Plantactinospora sp. WMMB782 TaxID=3404121 RepID=UPI003B95EE81
MGGRVLVFFLSYARSDDDPYVERFFLDLSDELRLLLGLPRDETVGFVDTRGIQLGAPWSPQLTGALAEAQTFVALLSPRYLRSEVCGREWQIFTDRMVEHQRHHGAPPGALFPILWLPPRVVPPAVAQYQYFEARLPEAYVRDGLRQLMRLSRNQDGYREFLYFLAKRIAEVSTGKPLPRGPHRVDFHQVPSAFHDGPPGGDVEPPPPVLGARVPGTVLGAEAGPPQGRGLLGRRRGPADVGPVRFVVVAPDREQAASLRQRLGGYGSSALDWAPYGPETTEPIGRIAQSVAVRRRFEPLLDRIEPGDDHVGEVSEQRPESAITVLVVDPWATRVPACRQVLVSFADRADDPGQVLAVLVPRSHQDPETQAHARELSDSLRSIFARQLVLGDDVLFRPSILSRPAFEADLEVVLEVARNRVLGVDQEFRYAGGQRPIVEGP